MNNIYNGKNLINAALGKVSADLVVRNAKIFNVFTREFVKEDLAVKDGFIVGLGSGYSGAKEINAEGKTIVPGFIDGHLHLESSVVTPKQYCRAVMPHGTTAIVADPHEIANVAGPAGIDYMLEATTGIPLDVFFMISSCVPATPIDENGYILNHEVIEKYLKNDRVLGLAEMMNYPGVLGCDEEVLAKIGVAYSCGKLIDGHAPGLAGKELNAYCAAGVESDHECTTAKEAVEKLRRGQWIMIREGTASRNLIQLLPLFNDKYYDRCILCTDDKHPGDLKREGDIDNIVRKAIANGASCENAYCMATINPARYFGLKRRGAICPGYIADFCILNDPETVDIERVFKNGRDIAGIKEKVRISIEAGENVLDTIHIQKVVPESFAIKGNNEKVIGLVPGQIITTDEGVATVADPEKDICKVAVVERHHATGHIGIAFLKGYGIRQGAVATSVAHDSHNIIVAGANDEDMAYAVSEIRRMHGGMVAVKEHKTLAAMPLPIAGLMCNFSVETAQKKMDAAKDAARKLGVHDDIDPFMTLSFASLPVIPVLRITTKGVVSL